MRLEWWGTELPYGPTLGRQRLAREEVKAGAEERLVGLTHRSVITTGRRPVEGLPDATTLAGMGVELHRSERGGLATWHGPGQLVVYALLDLQRRGYGVRELVSRLEGAVISWVEDHGVGAERRCDAPGVWVGGDKVCAVGLHVSRGCTMHGIALNLRVTEAPWSHFVPCGIRDAGVTSLHLRSPDCPGPEAAWTVLRGRLDKEL